MSIIEKAIKKLDQDKNSTTVHRDHDADHDTGHDLGNNIDKIAEPAKVDLPSFNRVETLNTKRTEIDLDRLR